MGILKANRALRFLKLAQKYVKLPQARIPDPLPRNYVIILLAAFTRNVWSFYPQIFKYSKERI